MVLILQPHPGQGACRLRMPLPAQSHLTEAWPGPVPVTLRITQAVLGMHCKPSPGNYFCPSGNKEVSPCSVTTWGNGGTCDPLQRQLTLLPCWEMTLTVLRKPWLRYIAFLPFSWNLVLAVPSLFLVAHTSTHMHTMARKQRLSSFVLMTHQVLCTSQKILFHICCAISSFLQVQVRVLKSRCRGHFRI